MKRGRFPLTPRAVLAATVLLALGACAGTTTPGLEPEQTSTASDEVPSSPDPEVNRELRRMYAAMEDGDLTIPAVPPEHLSERNKRQIVDYWSDEEPGTIVVDPYARFLYFVREDNTAIRYGVAVGEEGRGFSGEGVIPYQRDWPTWTPTPNMLEEDPELYEPHRGGMEGGLENPLGARALYLHRDGRDTLYRIHGTSNPWSIGKATSAGCIRLYNQDIVDLADRVRSGTKVIVLSEDKTGQGTRPPAIDALPPTGGSRTAAPASLPAQTILTQTSNLGDTP